MNKITHQWKITLKNNIRRLSPQQAHDILQTHFAYCKRTGIGIGDPHYRELTGGYSSQSIDFWITRSLAKRAQDSPQSDQRTIATESTVGEKEQDHE